MLKDALSLILLGAPLLPAQETDDALSWDNYASIREDIAPKATDFAFRKVEWESSVADGVNAARAVDKPVLLWLYFGNPQGSC